MRYRFGIFISKAFRWNIELGITHQEKTFSRSSDERNITDLISVSNFRVRVTALEWDWRRYFCLYNGKQAGHLARFLVPEQLPGWGKSKYWILRAKITDWVYLDFAHFLYYYLDFSKVTKTVMYSVFTLKTLKIPAQKVAEQSNSKFSVPHTDHHGSWNYPVKYFLICHLLLSHHLISFFV